MDARTGSDGALSPERESALLQSAQRGDPAALFELLRAHQRLLWRLCFALTAHRGEAEQMLTETARRAVRQLAQAPVGQPLAPWLAAHARTYAQARARRRAAGEQTATPPTRPSGESWDAGVLGPLAIPFEQALLARYVALAPEEQTLLALRLLERMSYGEIAAFLELPLTAVMHRVAALRERLHAAPAPAAAADDRMRHLSLQQMSASLDGALVGVAMEMVAKHLATCRECRERHAKLSRQDETLRRLLAWEPGAETREDMAIRIESLLGAELRGAAPEPKRAAMAPVIAAAPKPVPAPPAPAPAPKPEPAQPAPIIATAPVAPPAPTPTPAPEPIVRVKLTRPSRRKHVLAVAATLTSALLALLASLWLPPVIRVPVPDLPQPRVPRILLVHTPPARVTTVPESRPVTPAPTPAPHVTATPAPSAPSASIAPSKPARRVEQPLAHTPTPKPAAKPAPAHTPAPAPKPADTDANANWPLLCGEVLDDHGQPVAGARIALADLDLTARTDRRGHFCIAAPIGDRTLSVIAQGFATFRTVVDLGAQGQELHVSLDPAH